MFDQAIFLQSNYPAGILVHAVIDDKNSLAFTKWGLNKYGRMQLKNHILNLLSRANYCEKTLPLIQFAEYRSSIAKRMLAQREATTLLFLCWILFPFQ
jgi:hypothetical protein